MSACHAKAQVSVLILLLFASQLTQSSDSARLRFVAQLSVSGCQLFVHDTGAADGPHLAVEPVMCVTENLSAALPRYDSLTGQTYLSVAVTLRDDAMLAEVKLQLKHLSPKTVKFARVSGISVINDASSVVKAEAFVWDSEDPVGHLSLACSRSWGDRPSDCSMLFGGQSASGLPRHPLVSLRYAKLLRRFGDPSDWRAVNAVLSYSPIAALEAINRLVLTASIEVNGAVKLLNYSLSVQNSAYLNPKLIQGRYRRPPLCEQVRFVRSVRLGNCTARVHQRLGMMGGHFLVEPLMCYRETSMLQDPIRNLPYLRLQIAMQDDAILDSVRAQLPDLSPRSVTFMQLWGARHDVSSVLTERFEIGGLTLSGDRRSGVVRVYCRNEKECKRLSRETIEPQSSIWKLIGAHVTSLTSTNCAVHSFIHYNRAEVASNAKLWEDGDSSRLSNFGQAFLSPLDLVTVVIQQRRSGNVSFQRSWEDYENGFGEALDFWIGLKAVHTLTMFNQPYGAQLVLNLTLWNGTVLTAKYDSCTVANSSTNYRMSCRSQRIDDDAYSISAWDPELLSPEGVAFSTMDRDNDQVSDSSCSKSRAGKAGWWFGIDCARFNPNGVFGGGLSESDMTALLGNARLPIRFVRIMLVI